MKLIILALILFGVLIIIDRLRNKKGFSLKTSVGKDWWKKTKDIFVSKNFIIIFWRLVLLIIFVPFLLVYLNIYFQKREIKYVDTNPPAAQVTAPTQPRPSHTSKTVYSQDETMTYNPGERYFLNVPTEETNLDLIPLNTDEAYVTFYHHNTNNVAIKYHIFRSENGMITDPFYSDGSGWPGLYDLVFDREVVIQTKK